MSVDSEKKELRKVIQQKKSALSKEKQALEASVVFSQLESLSVFKKQIIYCYTGLYLMN